jgi:hypothetical protein
MSRGFLKAAGRVAVQHWTIVPSNDPMLVRPWAIVALTDGVAALVDEAGTAVSYPVTAGQQLNICPVKVLPATTATLVGWR